MRFSLILIRCLAGKEKGKKGAEPAQAPPPEPEPLTEEGEPPEPPPKTYVIKDRFDYFKPNIQVSIHSGLHRFPFLMYL